MKAKSTRLFLPMGNEVVSGMWADFDQKTAAKLAHLIARHWDTSPDKVPEGVFRLFEFFKLIGMGRVTSDAKAEGRSVGVDARETTCRETTEESL